MKTDSNSPFSQSNDIEKLASLIGGIRMAMLATVDSEGQIRSRPMTTQKTRFDGDLWFFTRANSPKAREIEADHQVNVVYSDPEHEKYVSVSGEASLVRDATKIRELWNPLYQAWFPEGLEDSELALLKVSVEKAEYWDAPESKMVQLVGFAKAILTGKSYKGIGEHEKVALH